MSVLSVQDVINTLSNNYDLNETLVITWWAKDDVQTYIDDEEVKGYATAEELWDDVVDEADNALDNAIGEVNDFIANAVYSLAEEEDSNE